MEEVAAVLEKPDGASPRAVGKLIKKADTQFDVAVLFPNSLRSALEAKWGNIPRIVGFAGHHRAWVLDQIIPHGSPKKPPEHQTQDLLAMVESMGGERSASAAGGHVIGGRRLPEPTGLRVGVCPGAAYGGAKRFPTEKFAETMNLVDAEVPGIEWVLVGTRQEAEVAASLEAQAKGRVENLAGKTGLEELIETLAGSRMLLTNDTGTMHLAAALGVPTVAIFGSTEPALTGPLGPRHEVVRNHVDCSPCFLRECPLDFRCMHSISVQDLSRTVINVVLREVPAGQAEVG